MRHGRAETHPDRAREWEPQRHWRGPRGRSLARPHSAGRERGRAYRLEAHALRVPTELIMTRRSQDPTPTLSIRPGQVHIGDRFTDADTDGAAEWEVMSRPVTFKKGHEVRARVQRLGNPATAREKYWAAHEKIEMRRSTVLSRAAAIIDEVDDEAARNRELRRLRAEIQRLEEEKQDLMRRLAFVERELEKTRAKIPRGMSTS